MGIKGSVAADQEAKCGSMLRYLRQQPTKTMSLPVKHASNINTISLIQGTTATHIHVFTKCSWTVNILTVASCMTDSQSSA